MRCGDFQVRRDDWFGIIYMPSSAEIAVATILDL